MKNIITLITLCLLLVSCKTEDQGQCVPDTMARLSQLSPITHSTSAKRFAKLLKTTSSGTLLTDIDVAWDSTYTNHLLIPILAQQGDHMYADPDYQIQFGIPYLWVGKHEQGNHCALLYIGPNKIILSHSQFVPGTTNYFVEERPPSWLFTNTYRLWYVK
jgi:hypothetical protein